MILLKAPLYPFYLLVKLAVRVAPERMLAEMQEEADLMFFQDEYDELAKFCDGAIILFPDDPRLHSMYAIALAETDPDKAAEMAKRAISLGRSL